MKGQDQQAETLSELFNHAETTFLRGTRALLQMGSKQIPWNALLLVLSLNLSGCTTGSGGPEGRSSTPRGGEELVILNYMETYLPRAAYMAKFEVIDQVGVSLLFPIREEDFQPVGPGTHRLSFAAPPFVNQERDNYAPRITGLLNQTPEPMTVSVLVVISDQPFALDTFLRSPGGLRDHLGGTTYINGILAVEAILETIIGDPGTAVVEYRIEPVGHPPRAWFGR